MDLFLIHVQPFRLLPPPHKTPSALALRFERLPPSQHLSIRLGHRDLVKCFKRSPTTMRLGPAPRATAQPSPAHGLPGSPPSPFQSRPVAAAAAAAAAAAGEGAAAGAGGAASFQLLPGLACIPGGSVGMAPMDEGAIGAAECPSSCLPTFPPHLSGGSTADSSIRSIRSSSSSSSSSSDGGRLSIQLPPPLARPVPSPNVEGWEGVGALAGDCSPVGLMDAEILQAVFAEEGVEEEGKGAP